jgi:hypothetical protein
LVSETAAEHTEIAAAAAAVQWERSLACPPAPLAEQAGPDASPEEPFTSVASIAADPLLVVEDDQAADLDGLAASTLLEGTQSETDCELTVSDEACGDARRQNASNSDVEPTKQGTLKILCPNCECKGELPWGRLDSLLCCTGCWHWYRIDRGGKLHTAAPPKHIAKGVLRMYRSDGHERIVRLTLADLEREQKRRAWSFAKLLELPSFEMNSQLLYVLVILLYLGGLFALGYWQFVGPTTLPRRPPPPVLSGP